MESLYEISAEAPNDLFEIRERIAADSVTPQYRNDTDRSCIRPINDKK